MEKPKKTGAGLVDKVFYFNDQPALTEQSDEVCEKLFEHFLTALGKEKTALTAALDDGSSTYSVRDLLDLQQKTSTATEKYRVIWCASSACAVLIKKSNSTTSFVTVVGLDGWESRVHSSTVKGREAISKATITKPAILDLGSIPSADVEDLISNWKSLMGTDHSDSHTGNSPIGHAVQRTPSFAWAKLVDAAVSMDIFSSDYWKTKSACYGGGTCDAGSHSGCLQRNTAFPLVASTIFIILSLEGDSEHCVFHKALCLCYLYNLRNIVSEYKSYDSRTVDRGVTVVRELEDALEEVTDDAFKDLLGVQVGGLHKRLSAVAPKIDTKKSIFPPEYSIDTEQHCCEPPCFPEDPSSDESGSKGKVKKDEVLNNLQPSRLRKFSTATAQDAWVSYERIVRLFWKCAVDLNIRSKDYSEDDLSNLRRLQEQQAKASDKAFESSKESAYIMSVELRSCKVLCAWITFCWHHKMAVKHHPVLGQYSAAIDPDNLNHLVLKDAAAIEAARYVQAFLRLYRKNPKFPFQNAQDTLDLAYEAGHQLNSLQDKRAELEESATKEIDDRYEKIKETQASLDLLDHDLKDAKAELAVAHAELREAEQNEAGPFIRILKKGKTKKIHRHRPTYVKCLRTKDEAEERVHELQRKIRLKEKPPEDVVLPLPKDKKLAYQWLFFFKMPPEYVELLKLVYLCQTLFTGRENSGLCVTTNSQHNLAEWYLKHAEWECEVTELLNMRLNSTTARAGEVGAKSADIRDYRRDTGVFFPDKFLLCPTWIPQDPFAARLSPKDLCELYTERLSPDTDKRIQSFVGMRPAPNRGNEGIVTKTHKPAWLSTEEYLAFASLRAFPNLQRRQLLVTIDDNQLPFGERRVQVLVRQLLFQIGAEYAGKDFKSLKMLSGMAEVLERKADNLKESPNNVDQLLLFGAVASFLGQFDERCAQTANMYKGICKSLALDVENEVRLLEKVPSDIYRKQAKLYACGLLSCCPLDDSSETLLDMVELNVLYKNKSLFASRNKEYSSLSHAVCSCMAKRIHAILPALGAKLSHLTKCLRQVVATAPARLDWKPLLYQGKSAGCFEAQSDQLYSINVLNGVILVDGAPPTFLSASVITHPLYRRTFGGRNFESRIVGISHFKSAKLIDGRFEYEFQQVGGQLQISEHDQTQDRVQPTSKSRKRKRRSQISRPALSLILIPRDTLRIPTLLKEPHSHWFSKKLGAIFFRNPSYQERKVSYVMTRKGVFRVPAEDAAIGLWHLSERIQNYDRLIFSETQVIQVLSRIETADLILPWKSSDTREIKYVLPRYGLEFSHRDGGQVNSTNHSGFCLHPEQTLKNTLRGVTTYLRLVDDHGKEKVLIPPGSVSTNGDISIPGHWSVSHHCYIYDVHPRFDHLMAKDSIGRLHLAGMYAASSCYLFEPRSKKSGTLVATELVRQCWTDRPLSHPEREKLAEVSKLSNLSCTLNLMCSWVWSCSTKMSFLSDRNNDKIEQGSVSSESGLDPDPLAVREYRHDRYAARMSPFEERYLIGSCRGDSASQLVTKPTINESQNFVDTTEEELKAKFLLPKRTDSKSRFPPASNGVSSMAHVDEKRFWKVLKSVLSREAVDTDGESIENDMFSALKSSWEDYRSLGCFELNLDLHECQKTLQSVKVERAKKEISILDALNTHSSTKLIVSRCSGLLRPPSRFDLLRLALDETLFSEVNPFLPRQTRTELRTKAVEWLMLCVLEDKLSRISAATTPQDEKLEDLKSHRNWDPWSHVRWLVFEVEQQIQIRPYQYEVVRQLQKNPNSMVQLNMGKGKTSVITPMLILQAMNKTLVRVNMLPTIMNVVKEKYQAMLTASVQHVKVRTLPFERSFPLDDNHSTIISEELQQGAQDQCCLLVTPQHRNSLLLKQHDEDVFLSNKSECLDIIDESDAILHQKYQQVFALGDQHSLPNGKLRWTMVEIFLQLLFESDSSSVKKAREDEGAMEILNAQPGTFPSGRLLPGFDKYEKQVGWELCIELCRNPPYECLWIKKFAGSIDRLVTLMSDGQIDMTDAMDEPVFEEHRAEILAARACIAHGLLFYCLRARHRVNYGIDYGRSKMAVPFAANNTPKSRSEFSHPDVQIIYTCLSYFHDGLSPEQLVEALKSLEVKGHSTQQKIFKSWIEAIKGGSIETAAISRFDDFKKVDIDNSSQLVQMHKALHRCTKVISFWMNERVFPCGTHNFPKNRSTSAWNLVDPNDGCSAIGFSGTDDNRLLLPLTVKQIPQESHALRAVNGEMISVVLASTNEKVELLHSDTEIPLWKVVLDKCISRSTQALIDVSGLMVGASNRDAATYVSDCLRRNQWACRGVVYFDTTQQDWMVLGLESHLHCLLKKSSFNAAECFVYFDESRCRGSDLQLKADACALVTLEPDLTKDKFLQGVARMRKLGADGQSLLLCGTKLTLKGLPSETVEGVLQLTIKNSVRMNRKGILELCDKGRTYADFPRPNDLCVGLDDLYAHAVSTNTSVESYLDEEVDISEIEIPIVQRLVQHCKQLGRDVHVESSDLSNECERELQTEEEKTEEHEMELEEVSACYECDWGFSSLFCDATLNVETFHISDAFSHILGEQLGMIKWSRNLHCTSNFRDTIDSKESCGRLYMRPVGFFLYSPDGKLVLISEYEANGLLPYWLDSRNPAVKLGHLTLASSGIRLSSDEVSLPADVRASAKLFRGCVNFEEDEKPELETLFAGVTARKEAILELLHLRNRSGYFERSDLDVFAQTSQ